MISKKKVGVFVVIFLLILAYVLVVYIFDNRIVKKADDEPGVEKFTKVGVLEFYFIDRYGCSVQSHLYYPSTYGNSSPPLKKPGDYPAVVFGCWYKGDNSIYEWIARNLTANGYVVQIREKSNNCRVIYCGRFTSIPSPGRPLIVLIPSSVI